MRSPLLCLKSYRLVGERANKLKRVKLSAYMMTAVKIIASAFILGYLLRSCAYQPYKVVSESMEPTLIKGDYVVANKFSYGYGPHTFSPLALPLKRRYLSRLPNRGDIIIFKSKASPRFYIKRLIGLPGDQVQVRNGELLINGIKQKYHSIADGVLSHTSPTTGKQLLESLKDSKLSYRIRDTISGSPLDNTAVYIVPQGHFFFLGDNRDFSIDSRHSIAEGGIGMIDGRDIIGRVEFVLLSVTDDFRAMNPGSWSHTRGQRWFKGLK